MSSDFDISKFIKVYSNLPLKVREEIIAVIDGEPVSWNVAHQEIVNNTEKGRAIFKKLVSLRIIDE